MVKLKRSPKTLELDIKVAKNGQFLVFPQQAANSMANVLRNTAGPDNGYW